MSSYLRLISCATPIPQDLSPLDLVLWTLSNVDRDDIGNCSNNCVYLNLSELPYGMYQEFKCAINELIKGQVGVGGIYVEVPTSIAQSLWNENTMGIFHQRLGLFNKEQWLDYCNTVNFYAYMI